MKGMGGGEGGLNPLPFWDRHPLPPERPVSMGRGRSPSVSNRDGSDVSNGFDQASVRDTLFLSRASRPRATISTQCRITAAWCNQDKSDTHA